MSVKIYSVPKAEKLYDGYKVSADGIDVPVRIARVSAMPFNRRWPGHQRQIEQSELSGFVNFAFDKEVRITVTPEKEFSEVIIRPLSKKINPVIEDGKISFTLTQRGGYTVELDGFHNALHIFADSFEDVQSTDDFDKNDKNTIYFGAGEHRPGIIEMESNQTLVIDEGAVVYCCIKAENKDNIKILGRGVLDNSENKEEILFEMKELGDGETDVCNSFRRHTIELTRCNNVHIEGITIRDSLVYNVSAHGCNYCTVKNIKTIGCWRYNSDGIDFHNSCRIHILDCFVRTFDDSICVKGHDGFQDICDDILVENCVVWCDWDHSLEIGAETRARHMKNIVFRNCDVIRSRGVVLDIFNVDYGAVHDVLFSDIRVEYDEKTPSSVLQNTDEQAYDAKIDSGYMPRLIACLIQKHHEYSEGRDERGYIYDITFENIQIFAPKMPRAFLGGYDEEHNVRNITVKGITLNGEKIVLEFKRNEYTKNIISE